MSEVKKVCIVGGVAAGMTTAVRLRRISEKIEIHVFERSPDISIASCGIPYYVSGDIQDRKKMALVNAPWAKARHNIDVHVLSEVTRVNKEGKSITVKDVRSGETSEHSYDRLVLCPGASPITGGITGVDQPGVFSLRVLDDMDRITAAVQESSSDKDKKKSAVVIGASFIGLEMTEALAKRGVDVTLLELAPQVLPVIDPEMAVPLHAELLNHGVNLGCTTKPVAIEKGQNGLIVKCENGTEHKTDFVIMCIGVAPESKIAREAGLELGVNGSIVVDEYMRTSCPEIYACGDVVQSKNMVLGTPMVLALAGPAVRQARIAAAHIAGHGNEKFNGVNCTSIVHLFDITAASVGVSEKVLKKMNVQDVGKLYLFSANKVDWFPTFKCLLFKFLFNKKTGKILGGQMLGREGVEKRIDVLSTAIQAGMTVRDLAQLELAYAPQFNAPKDILNVAGFAASNLLDGLTSFCYPDEMPKDAFILDVREEAELKVQGEIPGALNIPCGQLRARLAEVPKDKPVVVTCKVGLRGNHVMRMLRQNGYDAYNLSGGAMVYNLFHNTEKWNTFLSTKFF